MSFINKFQSNELLQQEVGILRQRIAELEAQNQPSAAAAYADFLFENSGESILIIDPYTMKILEANPNAARRLGYRRAELCDLALDQVEMPRSLNDDDAESAWQSSVSGTFFYESAYRHNNGTLIPVEVSSRLVFWQGRDVLINFVRDISWRKETETALRLVNNSLEEQLRQHAADLAAEKEKLEAVLGSIAEGVAMADANKKIVYVNTAFSSLTMYGLAEAQGRSFETMFDFAPRDLQAQTTAFAEGKVWSGEVVGLCQDGRTYPTVLTIVPILDEDGRITGYVTSHQDISRFKALDKAQYSFITNVSHQLRTPLTNIKLYTQLVEDGLSNGKAVHYLHVLSQQADRLEHLVQDILELASLDSTENVLDWRPVDLAEILRQVILSNQRRMQLAQQTLRYSLPEDLPIIKADPARLRQVFSELLDNAFAYTPAGTDITLEAALFEDGTRQWLKVEVQDKGPGIAPEDQAHVFDRFFRGHPAEQGNIVGTGLGLCIAQQITQAHHGHIAMESTPGQGTKFTVWLPVGLE
ncbi:MAG: PAS domain S-box protein [Ardenticatenaceae bacterium]|nr:PAS domain S-box protein [Ardenticatenaceae bacterium]